MQDHDPGVTDNESVLLDTYRRTLQHVDEDGRSRAGQGGELAYHNRFHVAQTLTALSYFLEHSNFETQHRLLALIVMAGHDLGHQGLSNEALGQQQESLTYDLLEPIWHSLTAEQKAWAHQWLVGTDPSLVKANHERFLKQPHDPLLGMQVLINEADVAGSLTSEFGQELTRRLLIERGNPLPTEQDVRETHKQFVSQVPLSSKQARFFLCDEQA